MAEQNIFFNRLRKLFSTQAIVTIDKSGKRKVVDTDERQINTNLLSLRDRYTKLQRSFYDGQASAQSMAYHQVRRELFRDYDAQDNDSILSSALDIYADECTTFNEFGEILQIRSNNESIKELLNNLFYDVLNVEFNLWPWIRNLCKYGDLFLTLEIGEGQGVINAIPQSVYYTERIEGGDPKNPNYVKFIVEQDPLGKKEYENYEMAHFRLLSDSNYLPYGKSMLEGGRRVWKQLCLDKNSKVWTSTGYELIKNIKNGTTVYSYDYGSKQLVPTTVKNVVLTGHRSVYEVRTWNHTIRGTYEHPVMISSGTYKMIGELTIDDYLMSVNHLNVISTEKVRSITELNPVDVYDLEVDSELHNFVVDGVIAHNCLLEDAMMIHRIMRAPEKRIFSIDIGNINPTEVDNYMQKIINKMKKVPFVDQNTGDYNMKYNMQNLTEDFFLPVRGGDSGTKIENLAGLEYTGIDDINYLKEKLFAALKIPKVYLTYDEGVSGKASIAAMDVRFARTIERIQRTVVSELTKIAIVHLAAQGIEDAEMTNFELSLTNASTIYEQEKINLWTEKVQLASSIKDLNMLSSDWQYANIFGLSEDAVEIERTKIVQDLKNRYRYAQIEQVGEDPANTEKQVDVESEIEELKNTDLGGRPKEGDTYGKDKDARGRDPLGYKENHEERKRDTRTMPTRESVKGIAKQYINGISAKKKVISEMLDEKNILPEID